MYMAMEYFPLGTLKGFIRVDQRLQEFEVRTITAQLLLGLADLHDQGYAHRDLKPDVSVVFRTTQKILYRVLTRH